MTVYIGSMCMISLALPCESRNRHENWATSSKHGHHYMRRRLEIQLQSSPWRQSSAQLQQRAGRLRVNCSSSTADPARDSRPSPIPTLYDFLGISQHVGEFLRTSLQIDTSHLFFAADRVQSLKRVIVVGNGIIYNRILASRGYGRSEASSSLE